jgi:hypothetical protein
MAIENERQATASDYPTFLTYQDLHKANDKLTEERTDEVAHKGDEKGRVIPGNLPGIIGDIFRKRLMLEVQQLLRLRRIVPAEIERFFSELCRRW